MFGSASINVNDLFDLSDRMAKGIDKQGNIIEGAIVEGNVIEIESYDEDNMLITHINEALGAYSHAEG